MLLKCTRCKDFKEEDLFSKCPSKHHLSRNHRHSWCKLCFNKAYDNNTEYKRKHLISSKNYTRKMYYLNHEESKLKGKLAGRREILVLTDRYVKSTIVKKGISISNISSDLIELQRLVTTFKRELKHAKSKVK